MKWVRFILLGWMTVGWVAGAESIDPCFPTNIKKQTEENSAQWPWQRIRKLEVERALILKKISVLPQHDPRFLSNHLGYHSLFNDTNPKDLQPPPHQLDFYLPWAPSLAAIALAPVFNPEGSKGTIYAFPKRFKIEILNPKTKMFDVIVNWMEEDFPSPGSYPVFFSGFKRPTNHIRITVPRTVDKGSESYYALGEVYLFRKGVDGKVGANMTTWRKTNNVRASDSFSMLPLWDLDYLTDGITGFGFPFSDETVATPDLMISYNETTPPQQIQLVLDLGKIQDIGRIDFWPAAAPYSLALPAFGFPQKILIELSADSSFKKTKKLKIKNTDCHKIRGNRISLIGGGYDARYVRITLTNLKSYKGKQILGLGEIMISNNEKVWSTHCTITATGIPPADLDQLPRLVDGYSRQRRILPQGEWIKGLALRRPLDRKLIQLEIDLKQARANWQKIKSRSAILGSGLVFVGLLGGLVAQQWLRRKGEKRLKWRITRDLHDEVGSNLGSISLTAEQLQDAIWDKAMKIELGDLALMAREASASLREVVWRIF